MRAVLVLVAFSASCIPADSPSGLRLTLSAVGIAEPSLIEARVLSAEGGDFTLGPGEFWTALDDSGAAGDWCSCVVATVHLFSAANRSGPAASIVIHDGEGMKLKAGGRIVKFESEALREAVRRRLKAAASS